jgi:hypothetical protein
MPPKSKIIIACPTILEEIKTFPLQDVQIRKLDFGLHTRPDKLQETLQAAINEVDGDFETIILGYGMCSNGVIGLKAPKSVLVVPRVSDCIAIFLGSAEAYAEQARQEIGTYYLTKGWIEVCDTPLDEHRRMAEKYGRKQADRMMGLMFQKYTRLGYILTGKKDQRKYRRRAREIAQHFALRYEEIQGSARLITKMVQGPYDDDFVVRQQGQAIALSDFY